MKCYEIIEKLERLSPIEYAEEWDNVGLLAGRRDKEVGSVYIALDATDEVIAEAISRGADMLLTHHPLIFHKLNRVNTDDFIGKRVYTLIREDIAYYAMHTNFDVMGMADAAAERLGLSDCEVLDETRDGEGCGRIGTLSQRMTLSECAELVKKCYQVPNVRIYGNRDTLLKDAAVMPGSGGSYLKDAIAAGADVMITGDIDHHEAIDAVAQGICIIDAGHYGIEKLFIPYMQEYLARTLPQLSVYCAEFKEPFSVL